MMDCYENYTNCMNCMNNDIWYNIIKYSKIKEVSIIIGLSKSNQSLNNYYVLKNLLERDYEKSRYWINNNPKNLDLQHIYLEIFKKPEHCFDHCIQVQILSILLYYTIYHCSYSSYSLYSFHNNPSFFLLFFTIINQ